MRTWLAGFALAAALAANAALAAETWIPLEDLTPEEQAVVLDAPARTIKASAPRKMRDAAKMHVAYAKYQRALLEAGADLLAGVR